MGNYHCLILAAGKSTRIASIAHGKPKPLLEISGESILSRNLRWLSSFNIKEAAINLHFKPEVIRKTLGDGQLFKLDLHYILESKILGTAGALRNANRQWQHQNTSLIIYGDNLFNFDLSAFFTFHKLHKSKVSIALFDQNKNINTGIAGGHVVINDDKSIQQFKENPSNENTSLVNAGAYLIEPEIIGHIPEDTFYDFGKDLFPDLLRKNIKLHGHLINGYCLGLDTPECFRKAEKLILNNEVALA